MAPPAPKAAPELPPLPLTDSETALLASIVVTEKLLVVQAVHQLGSSDFRGVAKLLQGHALLNKRSKNFFSADKCQKVWVALMKETGLDPTEPQPPNSPVLLQLAKKYYMQRVYELHALMQLEEDKFRITFSQIQEIKNGNWDDRMDSEVDNGGTPIPVGIPASAAGEKAAAGEGEKEASLVAIFSLVAYVTGRSDFHHNPRALEADSHDRHDSSIKTCTGNTGGKALTCVSGYFLNPAKNCVKTCSTGYFANKNTGKCVLCHDSSVKTCTGANGGSALTCFSGYYLNNAKNCVATCSSGFFGDKNTGKCTTCSAGYFANSRTGKCVLCHDSSVKTCTGDTGGAALTCFSGYYLNSQKNCVETCATSFFGDTNTGKCTKCKDTTVATCTGSNGGQALTCVSGYYLNPSKNCVATCPSKYVANKSTGTCVPSLQKQYKGSTFFDDWTFNTFSDPTHGYVNYINQSYASQLGLAKVQSDGTAFMSVDSTSTLASGAYRNSVRITSNDAYNIGSLIIADIAHVPYGCSVWPAFWAVGPNWPASTGDGDGCSVIDPSTASYGAGLAAAGGSVWATQWDSTGISIWRWTKGSVPADVTSGSPSPSGWGTPVANWPASTCDPASHFQDLQLVFDITLCGDWAGTSYASSSCAKTKFPTCASAVTDPTNFENAYFVVNSVSVYNIAI
ncbi:hypothetical protein MNV49_002209 [Pseudohyphozyma bogoriensis]|nr:hypothetical protein MNV49_002209 [Pseudohyphozyma bogoriensis]